MRTIADIDALLAILRESWMDAVEAKKDYWMTKIDAALDERLRLMGRGK